MGQSRICDAGETHAFSLLSSTTHKIGFPSKESKGIPWECLLLSQEKTNCRKPHRSKIAKAKLSPNNLGR